MGTKEQLLMLFEKNKGMYISGEEIARRLHVSRNAVWKAVNHLRKEGYEIAAVPNKGYCLSEETDILSPQGIRKHLLPHPIALDIEVLAETESTNTLLREKAGTGAPEGAVIIANAQTRGKGRMGRDFYSPADTGVYLSLLLRPKEMATHEAVMITTMAAVAASEAIEAVSGKETLIKWVNDLYVEGKKVAGILTEASLGLESGRLDSVVLGIGINAYPPKGGFPKEIATTAGAVFSERQSDGKNRLAAEFLNRFMSIYSAMEDKDFVRTYRAKSFVIGKDILVYSASEERKARALDVDDQCRLVVRYENGTTEALSSGEIRVRMTDAEGSA